MDADTVLMGARGFIEELSKQDGEGTYRPI